MRCEGRGRLALVLTATTLLSAIIIVGFGALADPMPICGNRGGAAGTFCTLDVPITMVSEDVSIRQNAEAGWSWNITAHYRFRNNSKTKLTVPIAFPVESMDAGCVAETSEFKARINGVLYEGYDFIECYDHDARPCPWAKFAKAKSTLPYNCSDHINMDSCNGGVWHCFVADFAAEEETVVHISYRFENLEASRQYDGPSNLGAPPVKWRKSQPVQNVGRVNSVPFVLKTGATWQGPIESIKLRYAVRDVPYDVWLRYGDRKASFEKSGHQKLGPFDATVVNGKGQTEFLVEGKNVEPDADISLFYTRNFIDLEVALISRCKGLGKTAGKRPAALERICKVLPHYYVGYTFKNQDRMNEIRAFLKKEGIEDPREFYRLPPSIKIDNASLLRRGKRQLNLFGEVDSPTLGSCTDCLEE